MNEFGLMATESGEMLALRGVAVSARITGLLAFTTLVQKYQNDTEVNLELSYTFPLPVSGTLLSFAVQMGKRKYEGQVIPRAQAEAEYEEAIGKGDSAFRLQELRAGMYNATLGNVLPGESVSITVTYAETLLWNGKSIRYRLPTTIAPRYGEPSGMQPWQRPETSLAPEYPLDITVSIAGELTQSSISCPSHKISMKLSADELTIVLAKGASMDRDFILELENAEVRSLGTKASSLDTNVAMLTILPPEVKSTNSQREVVLVIDCSGSMQGDSLKLAKEGLLLSLGSLAPSDRFGIVAFGTRFLQFDKELQPANRKNLDMSRRWINLLEDMGGTNINGAIDLALGLQQEKPMDILLLTDGQDWQVGESVKRAKANGVRIFTFGIGSAVAEESVRLMSDDTGGACELVMPNEDMSERVFRHFNRMRQPQLSRLEIKWPFEPIWESRPERACFAGDAYTVFAALPEFAQNSEASVSFDFAEGQAQTLVVPLAAEVANADAIVRLGAKQRLPSLEAQEQQAWAVAFQLISKNTDYLIMVDRAEDEKVTDLPELQTQPQMLPAGWGGSSSVIVKACVERAVLYSPAHSSYHNISNVSGLLDFSFEDVPAVCRKPSVTVEALANLSSNGYNKFIEKLTRTANGRLFRKMPTSLEQFLKLPIPDALKNLIDELTAEGISTTVIIHSMYAALLRHLGSSDLSENLLSKVAVLLDGEFLDDDVVDRICGVLDKLWNERSSGADRYDIPAFLRRSAN